MGTSSLLLNWSTSSFQGIKLRAVFFFLIPYAQFRSIPSSLLMHATSHLYAHNFDSCLKWLQTFGTLIPVLALRRIVHMQRLWQVTSMNIWDENKCRYMYHITFGNYTCEKAQFNHMPCYAQFNHMPYLSPHKVMWKAHCDINCTLSLQVWRTEVNYWKVDEPKLFASDSFPVVMYADKKHELCYYCLPIEEYPGLFKVGVLLL